jgi:uroporphyrin-III C-methyltransferase
LKPIGNLPSRGFVSLIGAGPGDPGLMTVKGLDRLRHAEVVLYDRLVAPQLLDEIDPAAETIDVGKAPTRHRFPQDEINALLVEKARLGKRVARLKGGDPFVFGRGGEECQALAQAGISYEVIPGVSSAIAVPAYAGIPLTQRGIAGSFTVIAGHTGVPDEEFDWEVLPLGGTLVFLMGVSHLPAITASLLAHGMPASTPVAVIERGTTPAQSVIIGSLENILERTQAVCPPATIVIGEVVRLREQIAWFESFSCHVAESHKEQ